MCWFVLVQVEAWGDAEVRDLGFDPSCLQYLSDSCVDNLDKNAKMVTVPSLLVVLVISIEWVFQLYSLKNFNIKNPTKDHNRSRWWYNNGYSIRTGWILYHKVHHSCSNDWADICLCHMLCLLSNCWVFRLFLYFRLVFLSRKEKLIVSYCILCVYNELICRA